MSRATTKPKDIEVFLSNFMGGSRQDTIARNKCVSCGGEANNFRDALSRKEYTISGLCQKCQDEFFGLEEE